MKKQYLQVRLNEDEYEYLKTEAAYLKISISDFVRRRLFQINLKPLREEKPHVDDKPRHP